MGLFDKFKKRKINKEYDENVAFSHFINTFKPSNNLLKPTEEELKQFKNSLPTELLNFWKEYGFGNYGDGIIKVINPLEYMENFYEWLGKEDFSKIPIILTAFGDVFYYRKLQDDVEDICLLSIHYRNSIVCSYSLQEFFKSYIVNEQIYNEVLRRKLFQQAYAVKGSLELNQIYFFTPALILGGKELIESIDRGDANIHQSILLKLGK
ncbi:GAD-like domain-containing protein [Clostridium sp. ZBS4]|uniref:GAD-like domain-containing protein n=1 Tax=Clostridium sp. ZBS4 TaxID=2949974 RepID=UPI00207AA59D|nr:GAD-like domain-containing protein [Clostridium sp. ZBS4]